MLSDSGERGGDGGDSPGRPAPPAGGEPLESIAGRILEGDRVDWEAVSSSSGGVLPPAIERMRELEILTEFHRSIQRSGAGGSPLVELQRWGHLEIIEPVGSGSFGTVYQAWDPRLDREVALKILHPERRVTPEGDRPPETRARVDESDEEPGEALTSPREGRRTIGEARLLAKVRHPNVVTVFGADECEGLTGIWMEMIHGETLWSLVRRQGPLSASEATAIGRDLLGALAAVHGAGILHRDIKPQNVMRAAGGRIVLMDLGIGKDLRTERGVADDQRPGAALYSAPERLRGAPASVRSDLYSLGVLLYFLVTGRHPYEGKDLAQLLAAHGRGARSFLRDRRPDLLRAFVETVERALQTNPADRFGSAGEMDAALAAAGTAAPAAANEGALRAGRPRPAWRMAAGLAAAALFFVAGASWWLFRDRYTIEAALYRSLPSGGQVSIAPNEVVASDSHLFFEIRATRDLYVYILRRTDSSPLAVLFPSASLEKQNPLRRTVHHRLPGASGGHEKDWTAGSGPRDEFLFVASPRRLAELEGGFTDLERPDYRPDSAGESRSDRALAPHWRDWRSEILPGQFLLHASPLRPVRESVKGTWTRKLELKRPG